jgi:DNA-directed RNA polymerase subunit H (RpoH/RPB5)
MHALQPKHSKLKQEEVSKLIEKYNISLSQLPKIKFGDPALPSDCEIGEVVKIERKTEGQIIEYFRVVVA